MFLRLPCPQSSTAMLYTALASAFLALTSVDPAFEQYKQQFNKSYDTVEEEAQAMAAYKANDLIIREHNARNGVSYTLGHNEFSDLTWEQFRRHYCFQLFFHHRQFLAGDFIANDAIAWPDTAQFSR